MNADAAVRIDVDLSAAMAPALGMGRGIAPAHEDLLRGPFVASASALEEALRAGEAVPLARLLEGDPAARARKLARAWGGERRRVVLGEPGALAACRAWAALAGDAGTAWCDDPGAEPELEDAHLVVLDGPPWVRALAEEWAARAASTVVLAGDGTGRPGMVLAGAETLEAPGIADARFGAFGPAALALAECAGLDTARVVWGARAGLRVAGARGFAANPACRLAAAAVELLPGAPVLLVPGALAPWARYLAGAWAAVAVQRAVRGRLVVREAQPPGWAALGDEARVGALLDGAGDAWLLALAPRRASPVERAVLEAHAEQALHRGRPLVRLVPPDRGPAALAAAAVVVLLAALLHAAVRDLDPTAMEAADDLRERTDRLLPGGDPALPG